MKTDKADKAGKANLKRLANVYIRQKDKLFPLMEKATGEKIDPQATHGDLVSLYIYLLNNDDQFFSEVESLAEKQNNAVDPVSAIADAIGAIAGTVGTFKEGKNIEAESEAELTRMILEGQKNNNTSTILIITGISIVAVGGLIWIIVKNRK